MKIGEGEIEFLGHSGFIIKVKGKIVAVDPYRISDNVPKADVVLISHSHNDHCSIRDIQKISKKDTVVFCPVDCQSSMMKVKNVEVHIVEKRDLLDFGKFKIECISAYTNNKHHPQNEGWLGYLVKFDKNVVYFSSDTDLTNEVMSLSGYGKKDNNFVAILPVSGTVAMDAFTAAKAASVLNSSIAIPHGYGAGVYGTNEDALKFVEICRQNGINAAVLDKI